MSTPPCVGRPEPYDVLIDANTSSHGYRVALREAVKLCKTCPLNIAAKCFKDNADEHWVKAIKGAKYPARRRPECGTKTGSKLHTKRGEEMCPRCREYNSAAWRRESRGDAA